MALAARHAAMAAAEATAAAGVVVFLRGAGGGGWMTRALVSDSPRCNADPSPALLLVNTIRLGPRVRALLTSEMAPP